jgi:hypothetical protein
MNNYNFRGKECWLDDDGKKVYGKWVYGAYLVMHHNDERKHLHHFIIPDNSSMDFAVLLKDILVEVLPKTVGQWTGLKDKNGKEIYDGDIVEITQGEATCKREVFFRTAMFALRRDDMAIWICNVLPKDMEVVGNIHDNPELLEDK